MTNNPEHNEYQLDIRIKNGQYTLMSVGSTHNLTILNINFNNGEKMGEM
jgi:hypothetical protein